MYDPYLNRLHMQRFNCTFYSAQNMKTQNTVQSYTYTLLFRNYITNDITDDIYNFIFNTS